MKKSSYLLLVLVVILSFAISGCGEQASTGSKTVTLAVHHRDGTQKAISIKTDKENLQDALVDEKLVSGTDSATGLFVTTVDNETADDSKQEWWCLTKDGEEWMYGIKDTKISDGDKFEFTLTTGY